MTARTGPIATIGTALWRRPYVLLPLPTLFWAGNLLIGRAYADEFPPLALAFWRWVIASACVLPFVWPELRRGWRAVLGHWKLVLACSASAFAGYPVLNYIALQTTPAATAAMLNSALPLMIPLIAFAIAREAPSPRTVAGIVVSFVGVGWIVSRGQWSVIASLSIGSGELLMLAAVACFALNSVLLRYRPSSISQPVFLATTMLAACIILLPLWLWEETVRPLRLTPQFVVSLLFIAVFASWLGNALWNHCVAALGGTLTGASFHLMAVYSSTLAFLLLGEPVRPFHLIGITLILSGFTIAVMRPRAAATSS